MLKIIDISHWNLVQDWSKVAKSTDAVILKCTQGKTYLDPTFSTNRKNARKNGVLVGAYHFTDGVDAIKEADWFIKNVGTMEDGEFLALDYEINLAYPVKFCKSFLDRCYAKTGVRPLLYMNTFTFNSFGWNNVGNYGLWLANYNINNGEYHQIPYGCVIHQYTSRGTVPGINGNVDLNYGFLDLKTLKKYGFKSPVSVPNPEISSTPTPTPNTPQIAVSDSTEQSTTLNPIPGKDNSTGVVTTDYPPAYPKENWRDAVLEIIQIIKRFFKL